MGDLLIIILIRREFNLSTTMRRLAAMLQAGQDRNALLKPMALE
jgi:hypothetical protein